MAETASTMLELGTRAPDFSLPDTDGRRVSRSEFEGSPLLVVFMCNHCPYVKHVREGLVAFAREYIPRGLAMVAVSANDAAKFPADSPERMAEEAKEYGYPFPYLYDETQEVARAYRAACTPDFFLFDRAHQLVYRGQFDDSRPGKGVPVTGRDVRAAADAALEGKPAPEEQTPSMGCSIKWKRGNEPDYLG
ncbi:MAG: thioredoxin family protein [Gammaproteobacteria bacterium]|nr:thioredoxin family protein [Gammaproteobacteria bacterium]NIR59755.1 thioredoxin family protein [Gammaproteobacteria bacterium]NIR89565.1 thioredoxin family protein [Gammaproteobacteria bacterium]NIV74807.1 redoxin domain-containing protein [Gammaproteobacteria bacterium]